MIEQVQAYIEFLSKFRSIERPKMPIFDVSAYTDNEYNIAIHKIDEDFQYIDDLQLTLEYLKGE